jgi:hypothetical protein
MTLSHSVNDSVYYPVRAVPASVYDSVNDSVWYSVKVSVYYSVNDSVRNSVERSVNEFLYNLIKSYDT